MKGELASETVNYDTKTITNFEKKSVTNTSGETTDFRSSRL